MMAACFPFESKYNEAEKVQQDIIAVQSVFPVSRLIKLHGSSQVTKAQ